MIKMELTNEEIRALYNYIIYSGWIPHEPYDEYITLLILIKRLRLHIEENNG